MFQIIAGPLSDSCFFGLGYKLLINDANGVVYRHPVGKEPTVETLPIKIPFIPQEMPPEDALDKVRSIKWLLTHGYIPEFGDNKITLVSVGSFEEALAKKCGSLIRIINKFYRYFIDQKLNNEEFKKNEYQEWHLVSQKADFIKKIELILCLLEEARFSLLAKNQPRVKECLVSLLTIAPESYGIKELYADVLRSDEAAKYYLELSGNSSEEASLLFLEKAIRANPDHPNLLSVIARTSCTAARTLHCYMTGYLLSASMQLEVAGGYAKNAKRLNDVVKDTSASLILSPRALDQSWHSIDTPSTTSSPKSPRLGLGRTQVVRAKKVSTVKDQSEATLKRDGDYPSLLWFYDGNGDWLRSEYLAKKLGNRDKYGEAEAKALEGLGIFDEAARLYLTLAERAYNGSKTKIAVDCLLAIDRIADKTGYGAFSQQAKRNLYILLLELNEHNELDHAIEALGKTLEETRGARPARPNMATSSRNHMGEWIWFAVDHPHYVAAASTLKNKMLFRKHSVDVFSGGKAEFVAYPLKFPPDVPDEVALFGAQQVRWLLAQGYIPQLQERFVTFVKHDAIAIDSWFIEKIRQIPCLGECVRSIEEGSWPLAYYYMHKAATEDTVLTPLYGQFLLQIKKPLLAMEVFKKLLEQKELSNEQKLYFFENRLIAASACKAKEVEELYKKFLSLLQTTSASKERVQLLLLHGYLYFQCHDPSKQETMYRFYNKAEHGADPFFAPWAFFACNEMLEERKRQYRLLVTKIAYDHERAHVLAHYRARSTEKMTALSCQKRDMKAFVETAGLGFLRLCCNGVANSKLATMFTHIDSQDLDIAEQALLQAREEPEQEQAAILKGNNEVEPDQIKEALNTLFVQYDNTALLPGWQASFDQFFADVASGYDVMGEGEYDDPMGYYLEQAERAKGKLQFDDSFSNNSICDQFSSLGLYYLECALACAATDMSDRAAEVYEAISIKLKTKDEAKAARFLLYLHAFFYFKKRGFLDHAQSFLARAEELNPGSLLLACAKLAEQPRLVELYYKVVAVCESEKRRNDYLDKQRDFIVVSSLEAEVKRECREILDKVERDEKRRATLLAVELAVEKKWFTKADDLVKTVEDSTSLQKRLFLMNIQRDRPFWAKNALALLVEKYKMGGKEDKLALVLRLYDKYFLQNEQQSISELFAQGRRDKAVRMHFDAAFSLFREGKNGDAKHRLQALMELNTYVNFTPEELFMLKLLHKRLNVDVEQLATQLESLTIVK